MTNSNGSPLPPPPPPPSVDPATGNLTNHLGSKSSSVPTTKIQVDSNSNGPKRSSGQPSLAYIVRQAYESRIFRYTSRSRGSTANA